MFMILFVLLDFVILGVICYDLKPAYFHHYVLLQGQIQTPYASIKGIYKCVCVSILFSIPFYYGLLQDIECSSQFYTLGLYWLSILDT